MVLLDGAKALYLDVLDLLEDHLRPGAFIVADDADRSPGYLERVRSVEEGYLSTPFAGDVELSMVPRTWRVSGSDPTGSTRTSSSPA